ncbi:MAG: HAD family hydrolase [Rhodanobacter sp.]
MPLALTLDLDDTLWPVQPALQRADEAVDAWLREHYPDVATTWPIPAMRALRAQIATERADLAHDFTTQRQLTMQQVFAASGIHDAPLDILWDIYFTERNRVDLYADSLDALRRLARRVPLASLTNGNADLQRIGIHAHFACHICARDKGFAKPDPRIFLAAAAKLCVAPGNILHVGDDPARDIVGAREAGLRTAWINRRGETWPVALGPAPELELRDLGALANWLDTTFDAI